MFTGDFFCYEINKNRNEILGRLRSEIHQSVKGVEGFVALTTFVGTSDKRKVFCFTQWFDDYPIKLQLLSSQEDKNLGLHAIRSTLCYEKKKSDGREFRVGEFDDSFIALNLLEIKSSRKISLSDTLSDCITPYLREEKGYVSSCVYTSPCERYLLELSMWRNIEDADRRCRTISGNFPRSISNFKASDNLVNNSTTRAEIGNDYVEHLKKISDVYTISFTIGETVSLKWL